MTVPETTAIADTILKLLAQAPQDSSQLRESVARQLQVSPEGLAEMLPSGRQSRFGNRMAWALVQLQRDGAISKSEAGTYVTASANASHRGAILSPVDAMERVLTETHAGLAALLLGHLFAAPPAFLEATALDLMEAMGVGHRVAGPDYARGDADGGLDGVLASDPLGQDRIAIQAKRYARGHTVGRPVVDQLIGALMHAKCQRAVLITTSSFTKEARDAADHQREIVTLIDGEELALLMIQHGVGTKVEAEFRLMQVDQAYFPGGASLDDPV